MTNKKSLKELMEDLQDASDAFLDYAFSIKSINLESKKNERI